MLPPPNHALGMVEKCFDGQVHQADFLKFGHMVQRVIEYWQFCKRKFQKIKTKIFKEIEANFDIFKKPLMSETSWRWFIIFKPKMWKILNFELLFSFKIHTIKSIAQVTLGTILIGLHYFFWVCFLKYWIDKIFNVISSKDLVQVFKHNIINSEKV